MEIYADAETVREWNGKYYYSPKLHGKVDGKCLAAND